MPRKEETGLKFLSRTGFRLATRLHISVLSHLASDRDNSDTNRTPTATHRQHRAVHVRGGKFLERLG